MTQVVLSLEEKYNKKLRWLANDLYEGRKGSMSAVVERGIDLVEEKMKREKAYGRLLALSEGARVIGIGRFKREEAYAR